MSIAIAAKMASMQAEIDALWRAVTELRAKEIEAEAKKRKPLLELKKGRTNEDDRIAASLSD